MNHARRLGIVVAVCLGLAACGGSSSSTTASLSSFKSAFSVDQTQFRHFGVDLGEAIAGAVSKSDAFLATEFGKLSSRAQEQASRLAKLNPPASFKPDVGKLSAALTAIGSDLSEISSAAGKHDVSAAKAATRKLVGSAETVKSADSSLSKRLGLTAPGA